MKRSTRAVAVVCLGAVVAPLDTAVNVAFPAIVAAFGVAQRDIVWVVISFVLTQSLSSLLFGRLGDLYGHRRMFIAGIVGSILAHAALAFAADYLSLVALRALQGAAVGMTMACAPALVSGACLPDQRPRALALYASAVSAALAIGPIAGGWLVEVLDWPGVFLFRVPVALLALLLAPWWLSMPRDASPHPRSRPGLTLGLGVLMNHRFVALQCASVMVQAALFSIMLWVPFALTTWTALPVTGAGVLITLFPAGSLAASLWLARHRSSPARISSKALVSLGQWLAVTGLAASAVVLPLQSVTLLAPALTLAGIGLGVFQIGYQEGTLDKVPPEHRGLAGSLINVTRLVGIVLGALSLGAVGERLGVAFALGLSAVALACWASLSGFMLRRSTSMG